MPILTAAQAQQAIQTVNTQAEFYNVFNSVDVSAPGGTTILYSGRLGNLNAQEYANASAAAASGVYFETAGTLGAKRRRDIDKDNANANDNALRPLTLAA